MDEELCLNRSGDKMFLDQFSFESFSLERHVLCQEHPGIEAICFPPIPSFSGGQKIGTYLEIDTVVI